MTAELSAATGTPIGKRQVEQLAARAAQDFDAFYAARESVAGSAQDFLVLTFDGKGIPMLTSICVRRPARLQRPRPGNFGRA